MLSPNNPDKAHAERWFLIGTPVWIAMVAAVMLTGWLRSWGDAGFMIFSVGAATPALILPLLRRGPGCRPILKSYYLKLHLFVGVLVLFGTYIGTHYFFDLMGMRYAFPARLVLESDVVGRSGQHVPLFMYPLTQAYFVSYFTVLTVSERALRARLRPGPVGRLLLVLGLSYAIAFAETFFMATDWLRDLFSYADRGRMLALGSFGYASYFVVGLPMLRQVDEDGARSWPIARVLVQALAAAMLILTLLELWAKIVGPLS